MLIASSNIVLFVCLFVVELLLEFKEYFWKCLWLIQSINFDKDSEGFYHAVVIFMREIRWHPPHTVCLIKYGKISLQHLCYHFERFWTFFFFTKFAGVKGITTFAFSVLWLQVYLMLWLLGVAFSPCLDSFHETMPSFILPVCFLLPRRAFQGLASIPLTSCCCLHALLWDAPTVQRSPCWPLSFLPGRY